MVDRTHAINKIDAKFAYIPSLAYKESSQRSRLSHQLVFAEMMWDLVPLVKVAGLEWTQGRHVGNEGQV